MNKKLVSKAENGMIIDKLPAYFLFGLIALTIYYLYVILEPFLLVLIFSMVLATVTFPLFRLIQKKVKGKNNIAAAITCLIVVVAIIIPMSIFVLILVQQFVELYNYVGTYIKTLDLPTLLSWRAGNLFYDLSGQYHNEIESLVRSNFETLKSGLTESAKLLSSWAARESANILKSVGFTVFSFFLMLFVLYFLYRDGDYLVARVKKLSPIPLKHEEEIIKKFKNTSTATLLVTFLTAFVQGLVAWIGFLIAGVPNAFFWATAVSIASLIPVLGTGLVTIPIGLAMMLGGNIATGVFLLIWGFGLVSTVDNLVRIVFIGSSVKLNALLTFLAVFGGITAFGLPGVIFGPMILVLTITLLHIYEMEYQSILTEGYDKSEIQEAEMIDGGI